MKSLYERLTDEMYSLKADTWRDRLHCRYCSKYSSNYCHADTVEKCPEVARQLFALESEVLFTYKGYS